MDRLFCELRRWWDDFPPRFGTCVTITIMTSDSSSPSPSWLFRGIKVGTARRFSIISRESLVADLRRILAPQYLTESASSPPG